MATGRSALWSHLLPVCRALGSVRRFHSRFYPRAEKNCRRSSERYLCSRRRCRATALLAKVDARPSASSLLIIWRFSTATPKGTQGRINRRPGGQLLIDQLKWFLSRLPKDASRFEACREWAVFQAGAPKPSRARMRSSQLVKRSPRRDCRPLSSPRRLSLGVRPDTRSMV